MAPTEQNRPIRAPEGTALGKIQNALERLSRLLASGSPISGAVGTQFSGAVGTQFSISAMHELNVYLYRASTWVNLLVADYSAHRRSTVEATEILPGDSGAAAAPSEPPPGLLMSMAIRMDHGLGCPGYYDQPLFESSGLTHVQRLEAALVDARKAWEEVTGRGFYHPERESSYVALRDQSKKESAT